jgi:hypothetical protein
MRKSSANAAVDVFALVTVVETTSNGPSGCVPDEVNPRAPPQAADQGKRVDRDDSFERVSNELSNDECTYPATDSPIGGAPARRLRTR